MKGFNDEYIVRIENHDTGEVVLSSEIFDTELRAYIYYKTIINRGFIYKPYCLKILKDVSGIWTPVYDYYNMKEVHYEITIKRR